MSVTDKSISISEKAQVQLDAICDVLHDIACLAGQGEYDQEGIDDLYRKIQLLRETDFSEPAA